MKKSKASCTNIHTRTIKRNGRKKKYIQAHAIIYYERGRFLEDEITTGYYVFPVVLTRFHT